LKKDTEKGMILHIHPGCNVFLCPPPPVWKILRHISLGSRLSMPVISSRFVKNGNIFGSKSDRLTKLAPLMKLLMNHISMVTNAPGVKVGSRNRTMF